MAPEDGEKEPGGDDAKSKKPAKKGKKGDGDDDAEPEHEDGDDEKTEDGKKIVNTKDDVKGIPKQGGKKGKKPNKKELLKVRSRLRLKTNALSAASPGQSSKSRMCHGCNISTATTTCTPTW